MRLASNDGEARGTTRDPGKEKTLPWKEESYLRFFPTLTWQSNPQVDAALREVPAGGRVVDLGSGEGG